MSRSYKKNPGGSITVRGDKAGQMKKWKKQSNRQMRRLISTLEELPQNTQYRKMKQTLWDAPCDGKHWHGKYLKSLPTDEKYRVIGK